LNGIDLEETKTLFADGYPAAYQTLYEAKPITCSVTGTTFDAVPAPCAVILDVSLLMSTVDSNTKQLIIFFYLYFQYMALPQLQATRALSGRSVPIVTCVAFGAGAIIRLFGPKSMGGLGAGDIGAKIDAEVARTGLSVNEIDRKVHMSCHASRRN
jgi:hypothetical protein